MGPSRLVGAEPRPILRGRWVADPPVEGSGFEPSVPLPRLSLIRAVRAEIIGRSTDVLRRDREFDVSRPPRKTQHVLPKSVFDRPGSERWNLASILFLTRDRWFE